MGRKGSKLHKRHWAELGELVNGIMEAKGIPGVSVGILYKGERATAGFGVTNVEHPLPVTDETLFQVGSITKTYTGTAIMRLVERGQLALETRVREVLPDFKVVDEQASEQATVAHLLTHTSGWVGDFFDDTGAGDDALAGYVSAMAGLEQLAPLGEVWSYNNAGFSLAGRLIEVVTGKSYEAVLKEMLLEPLGLSKTFLDPGDVLTHRFVAGHMDRPEGTLVARPWPLPRSSYAAGGITCHVKDLLRYAAFHLREGKTADGERLLKAKTVAEMQKKRATIWGEQGWGLSWAVDRRDGVRLVSHGGGTLGQVSQLLLVPERDFAVAILTNSGKGGLLTRKVGRRALQAYLGITLPEPSPIAATEEELAPYVGRYARPFAEVELGLLAGRLVGQITPRGGFPTKESPPSPAPPPMTLALSEPDRLLALDGPYKDMEGEIVRKPDGSIGWLRVAGRIHVRVA